MPLSEEQLIERFSRLDTCTVSDGLDALKVPGYTTGIKPQWQSPKVVGRAVTLKVKPVGVDKPTRHLAAAAIDATKPGDVLVIDNTGRPEVSSWGGLLSLASTVRGVSAVVIDGACRDIDEAREMGFPIFARSVVSITARNRIMQDSVQTTISCGGVQVQPGDLVIADGSGVVFVPWARAEEVLDAAEGVASKENEMAEALKAGRNIVEVMEGMNYNAMTTAPAKG